MNLPTGINSPDDNSTVSCPVLLCPQNGMVGGLGAHIVGFYTVWSLNHNTDASTVNATDRSGQLLCPQNEGGFLCVCIACLGGCLLIDGV